MSALLAAILTLVFASGGEATTGTGNQMNTPPAYSDPAEPIAVEVGSRFSIVLPSNPSTGYSWQLAEPGQEKVVRLLRHDYREPPVRRRGAAGEEAWTFTVTGPGTASLLLKYSRPWENDKPPLKRYSFTVTARR